MGKLLICFNFREAFMFLLVPILLGTSAFAQDSSGLLDPYEDTKELTVEWEPVEGSFQYEIEVQGYGEQGFVPVGKYKLKTTSWSSRLNPGKYQFRIRGIDARGVPGLWGEYIPFLVTVPPPTLQTPLSGSQVKAEQDKKAEVEFSWKSVKGATAYVLEVFPEKMGEAAVSRLEVQEASIKTILPVGKKYRWHVYSIDIQKNAGDPVKTQFEFVLVGKKIPTPEIDKPESEFINKVNWSKPASATYFNYTLSRQSSLGSFEIIEKKDKFEKNVLPIQSKFKGGQYRLQVRALGEMRPASDIATLDFPLYDGERTAKAMESAKLRRAMELDKENYIIASYLFSSLSYTGDNKETGNRIVYTALGGTGRIGYGYMPKSRWGWTAIVDLGGVNLLNKNYTFVSAEVMAIWRKYLGIASQVRLFSGLYIRETPEAKAYTKDELTGKNIQQLGPVVGAQFWTSFNYRYGLQVNAQMNLSALKLVTPNGQEIIPSLSYQIGAMGSYKVRENLTGFAGVAYRLDKASYKAKPYLGGSELNFASAGDVNSVTMIGTYLNLYAEWGF